MARARRGARDKAVILLLTAAAAAALLLAFSIQPGKSLEGWYEAYDDSLTAVPAGEAGEVLEYIERGALRIYHTRYHSNQTTDVSLHNINLTISRLADYRLAFDYYISEENGSCYTSMQLVMVSTENKDFDDETPWRMLSYQLSAEEQACGEWLVFSHKLSDFREEGASYDDTHLGSIGFEVRDWSIKNIRLAKGDETYEIW